MDTVPDDTYPDLRSALAGAGESLAEARRAARAVAVAGLRRVERELALALAGEPLRGLKNLGLGTHPYYGAQIRAEYPDARLVWPRGRCEERRFLCLDSHGVLVLATCASTDRPRPGIAGEHGEYHWDPRVRVVGAHDDDFLAEDLPALVAVLREILPRHLAATARTTARYAEIRALAGKLEGVL